MHFDVLVNDRRDFELKINVPVIKLTVNINLGLHVAVKVSSCDMVWVEQILFIDLVNQDPKMSVAHRNATTLASFGCLIIEAVVTTACVESFKTVISFIYQLAELAKSTATTI